MQGLKSAIFQHARIPHKISKIIIILDYYEFLAMLEGKIRKGPFFYDSIL